MASTRTSTRSRASSKTRRKPHKLPAAPKRNGTGEEMNGAQMIIRALHDHGVDHIFGYPGGAILPVYDSLFGDNRVNHILVRHEQAAVHAAEGYARSTGKVGCALVTSGPGSYQLRHRFNRRADGFRTCDLFQRTSTHAPDRHRRIPRSRHKRYHTSLHQA